MSASQRQRAAEAEGQDVVHEASIQPTSLGLNIPGTGNTLADGSSLSTAGMFSGVSDGDRMLEAGEGLIPAEGSGRDTAANRMIAGELMAQRAAKAASYAATETVGDPANDTTEANPPGWFDDFTKRGPTGGPLSLTVENPSAELVFKDPPGKQSVVPPIAQKSAINNAVIAATADEDGALSFQDKIDALNAAGYGPQKVSDEFTSMALKEAGFPGDGTPTQNNRYYKDLIKDIMGDDKSDKEKHQEKWNNFAMIGFAIAAGQSPSAMTNIAQGMLQGTKLMANQREADQARRDKLKGMEFDMLLSDRAAGQDRKTKFGVAGINADSRAATAAAKAAAEGFLDTDVGKGMDKIFASLVVNENAVQTPNALMEALKKLLNSPAYNEEQQDNFILAKGFNQATIDAVREGRADSSSSGKTTMKDIPD